MTETNSSGSGASSVTVATREVELRDGVYRVPTSIAGHVLEIKADQRFFTAEQMIVLGPLRVKADYPIGEVLAWMADSFARGLDPYRGESVLMRYGKPGTEKETFVRHTTIQGFRSRAFKTGEYRGKEPTLFCGPDGVWSEIWPHADRAPYACKIIGHREGHMPESKVVYFEEFVPMMDVWEGPQGNRRKTGEQPTPMWRPARQGGKPLLMIEKCCEAAMFRALFPDVLGGYYEFAEMEKQAAMEAQDPAHDDASATARRAAYAAAHPGKVVDGDALGVVVTETSGDAHEMPLADDTVRALLLAELDAQARLLERDRQWMVRVWESRAAVRFADAPTDAQLDHVHRFRGYVLERLRATDRFELAARYAQAPRVGTLVQLFGTDAPWDFPTDTVLNTPAEGRGTEGCLWCFDPDRHSGEECTCTSYCETIVCKHADQQVPA